EENEQYKIRVVLNKDEKTIRFTDNGLGMTADEIKQYINQIAFSGASDFMEKYKDKIEKDGDIIGHFGLGFYSAFMVAEKVRIDSLSYKADAEPAGWLSDGSTEYELFDGERKERGTTITLFLNEDGAQFLDEYKLKATLRKYCGFIPVEIYFETEPVEEKPQAAESGEPAEEKAPEPINDIHPLWLKKPGDVTDEEYKAFYHKVFSDFNEPLFWIHLNMDYPFNLKGILYFPKLKHELESIEGQVKLYNNQVFIADNIKEVIPEFLLLLKGVLDCPDLPLNVSRSFLQNDGYVTKMSNYITKKVADKLTDLFRDERENYNNFWDDINQFIKYGCIRDKNFYDKAKDALLYKTLGGEYLTASEYLEKNKEKEADKIFYVTNEQQQSQYIKLFQEQEIEAVLLTTKLDAPFMSYVESYEPTVHFARIDADLSDSLKDKTEEGDEHAAQLTELFKKNLGSDSLKINVESLKSDSVSAVMLLSEQSRRMQEMSVMFGGMGGDMGAMFSAEETLVLNKNNALVKHLIDFKDDENKAGTVKLICEQIYDLAMLSHKPLAVEAMTKFISRSNDLMSKLL
ncbi:MAG: molecular chaperone HtpG, partial [Clostridiales bacterium]|nr:molecular chaperone HtpG [Clostridiales bacterium]